MKTYLLFLLLILSLPLATATPVIFDTDIGNDIDDTWALGYLLCLDELDLKLVLTDYGDTKGKAKIAAKFLETVGRTDVAIGFGEKQSGYVGPQAKWAEGYNLTDYDGEVYEDGIGAVADIVNDATDTVLLIVAGPCPNIPVLLKRYPDIVKKIKVAAMSGSIRKGYDSVVTPDAEYNVRTNVPAARALYSAGWDLTIAPLDTSAEVRLSSLRYQKLIESRSLVSQTIREAYRIWNQEGEYGYIPDSHSPVLYDTLAVYLGYEQTYCKMNDLYIQVNEYGFTRIDSNGQLVHVAIGWNDRDKYLDHLVQRLSAGVVNAHFPDEEQTSQ